MYTRQTQRNSQLRYITNLLKTPNKGKLLKAEKNDTLHIERLLFKILWISHQKTQRQKTVEQVFKIVNEIKGTDNPEFYIH